MNPEFYTQGPHGNFRSVVLWGSRFRSKGNGICVSNHFSTAGLFTDSARKGANFLQSVYNGGIDLKLNIALRQELVKGGLRSCRIRAAASVQHGGIQEKETCSGSRLPDLGLLLEYGEKLYPGKPRRERRVYSDGMGGANFLGRPGRLPAGTVTGNSACPAGAGRGI